MLVLGLAVISMLGDATTLVAHPEVPVYGKLTTGAAQDHLLQGRPFWFTLGGGDDSAVHTRTLSQQPIADRGFPSYAVGEWEYSFHHLKNGQEDGAGYKHYGGYPTPPKSRAEAAEVVKNYFLRLKTDAWIKATPEQQPCFVSFNGHYCYQHYACEWGCDVVGSEVGENINSIQMHIAFTRGAARQYDKPWLMDFSSWYGPSIIDEDPKRHWADNSGPTHGHSVSLHLRTYLVSYMAGANAMIAEGGWLNFFRSQEPGPDGTLPLSTLGKEGARFYRFTQRHPERGTPYNPIAVVLPFLHGIYPGFDAKTAWDVFPYAKGDRDILSVMNTFFPGSLEVLGKQTEHDYMVASPYGDIMDVILSNAPDAVLSSYPVLLLAGEFEADEGFAQRLRRYIKQGGTLLVGERYLENKSLANAVGSAPASLLDGHSRRKVGDGAVIVFGESQDKAKEPPLSALLSRIRNELIPIDVTGSVQTLYNRTKDGWLVTLVNNKGITKSYREATVVDPRAAQTVALSHSGHSRPTSATLWTLDGDETLTPDNIRVTIPPGEFRVVQLSVHTR